MKWEYRVVPVTSKVHLERYIAYKEGRKPIIDCIQDVMNVLGEVGWKLVSVHTYKANGRENVVAYFKRPKEG